MSTFDRKKPKIRPQLTLPIFLWALVDVVGMLLVSLGVVYFVYGAGRIFARFPGSTAEAAIVLAAGAGIMIWAAGNIVREMVKQPQFGNDGDDAR